MIDPKISDMILALITPESKVLDVGGGRHPYFRANSVIDKRSFDERVGDTAFAGSEQEREYFSSENWVSRDFFDLPWPFEDNHFDFCVCMHTLEDLRDPIAIAREIQRVSKAGYISTPTRALESSKNIKNRNEKEQKYFGYFHHKWFVEIENNQMVFRAKNQLLYGDPVNQIENWAQSTLHYFWKDSFDVREDFLAGIEQGEEDMSRFSEQHKNWLEKLRQGVYLDSLYNFWDPSLGPAPDFSQLVDGDLSGVGPKTKVNPVGKMIHSLFNNQNV